MRRAVCASLIVAAATLGIAAKEKDRVVILKFVPQESTGASSPSLPEPVLAAPIAVAFEDARTAADKAVIGEGTGDDEEVFTWRAGSDIPEFTKQVFLQVVSEWGVKVDESAPRVLTVKLMRFHIKESDQAVGSTYAADAKVAGIVKDRNGRVLTEEFGTGDAHRYGRKRSADNCAEVLSDAIKEAYANLLDDPGLQAAWTGQAKPSAAAQAVTPKALLDELTKLKAQGFGDDLLVDYVGKRQLATPLQSEDLVEWKKSGLSDAVIKAAVSISPSAR